MDIGLVETVLRDVGYPLVRRAVPVTPGSSRFRLDVVAWGPDPSGELVPQVAVEIKRHSGPEALPNALRQLAIARDVLGTNRHYVVLADRWYVADAGLINAAQVDGPESPATGGPWIRPGQQPSAGGGQSVRRRPRRACVTGSWSLIARRV
jgi:hypothetical protein